MTKRKIELTKRDTSLLKLLKAGKDDKTIAKKLNYTHGTTRGYLHKLYKKLGVNNRTAAAAWFAKQS